MLRPRLAPGSIGTRCRQPRCGVCSGYIGSAHFGSPGQPLTQLYGPAVRCKPKVNKWRGLVLRICIRPFHGAFVLLAIMDIRAQRPLGSPDHRYDGETVSPFPPSDSQTSTDIVVFSSVASRISAGHLLNGPEHVDLIRPLARRVLRSCDLVPTQCRRSAPA